MSEDRKRLSGIHIPGSPAVAAGLAVGFALSALVLIVLIAGSYAAEGGIRQVGSTRMKDLRSDLAVMLEDTTATAAQREALKREIRNEDVRIRRVYFSNRARRRMGGYVLAGLLALGLGTLAWRRALVRQSGPISPPPIALRTRPQPRWPRMAGTAGMGIILAGILAIVSMGQVLLPLDAGGVKPVAEVFRDNWPSFRGPGGQGIVSTVNRSYPEKWDIQTGENIFWKVKVELPGKSSPILWGNRVFLTGGDKRRRAVLCYDRTTGKPLFSTSIRTPAGVKLEVDGEPLEIYQDTGWAAPTPVTDGKCVYAMFATGDVAAVDFDGKVKWVRNLGVPDSAYSFAASPVLHKGKLIIQFDQGYEAAEGKSKLIALNTADGKTVWSEQRPVGGSWSSPVIFKTASGVQLITCASPWVIAYEPVAGKETWRAKALDGDVAPAPVYADGVVYVTNDQAWFVAIRTNGRGDVTRTHVLWRADDGLSDIASPLTDGKRVLQARDDGEMTCYNAKTGVKLWDRYADVGFKASPSLLDGVVYWPDNIGNTLLFKLADEFKLIRKNDLHEPLPATPAFGDGRIYFRGTKHLFCVGKKQ